MLQKQRRRKWTGFLLVFLLVLGSMTSTYRQFANFPHTVRLFQGDWRILHLSIPVSVTASVSDPDVVHVNGARGTQIPVDLKRPMMLFSQGAGSTSLTLKLFGALPIKKMMVQVIPPLRVIPGGQSIGVKLKSSGVLVVGHHLVQTAKEARSPGEKADIRVGDYLVKMDNQPIRNMMEVAKIAEQAGKEKRPIEVTLIRQGKQIKTSITPLYDRQEHAYRLGLYIRSTLLSMSPGKVSSFCRPGRNRRLSGCGSKMRRPLQLTQSKSKPQPATFRDAGGKATATLSRSARAGRVASQENFEAHYRENCSPMTHSAPTSGGVPQRMAFALPVYEVEEGGGGFCVAQSPVMMLQ